MEDSKGTSLIWIFAVVLLAVVGLMAALFAVDFAAGAALVAGIAGALALRWLISRRASKQEQQMAAPPVPEEAKIGRELAGDMEGEDQRKEKAPGGMPAARPTPAAPAPSSPFVRPTPSRGKKIAVRILIGVVAAGLCVGVAGLLVSLGAAGWAGPSGAFGTQPPQGDVDTSICPEAIVTDVRLVVEPTDLKQGMVTVGGLMTAYAPGTGEGWAGCEREQASEPFTVALEPATYDAHKIGTLLWEVSFYNGEQIDNSLAAAGYTDVRLRYTEMSIELRDFPRNAFFNARAASGLEVSSYLNTQTATWTQRALDPVTFSYIPPAWRFARPLLSLSYSAGSVGEGVVVIGSAVGTFAVSSVFQQVIGDYGKAQLGRLGRTRRRRRGK